MTKVRIPPYLRRFTNQLEEVQVEGKTVAETINCLEKKYPGIKKKLLDKQGEIKKFINIYLGDEDIRFLNGKKTEVQGKDVIIVPAFAGG